jgi:TPR repeat protein
MASLGHINSTNVKTFLSELHLDSYYERFEEDALHEWRNLVHIKLEHLLDWYGMKLGNARTLLRKIRERCEPTKISGTKYEDKELEGESERTTKSNVGSKNTSKDGGDSDGGDSSSGSNTNCYQEDDDEPSHFNGNNQATPDRQKSTKTSSLTNKEATDITKSSKKVKYHPDPCSICMDLVDLLDISTYSRHICCGKVLHDRCKTQIYASDMRDSIKHSCPMCRQKNAPVGSKEEIERLREWVQRDRPWAQLMLGERYRDGVGVKTNAAKQLELFTSAAALGHAQAQVNLAIMYENGNNVKEDGKLAVHFYTLASEQGHTNAHYALGYKYQWGKGLEPDVKRAIELYTLAAEQGHVRAQLQLGGMYGRGQIIQLDETLSFKYTKLSADQGVVDAQFEVAVAYADGTGVEQSDIEAVKYYKLAANQGDFDAQFNLASMYADGQGVIQSDDLALKFYKLCAEAGDADAQFNVGNYYYNGTGEEQSLAKAREWWIKAAKQGDEVAIESLKELDEYEGITSSSNFTDNSTVLCSKCNKPAQTNRALRSCICKGAQYCNNTCYHAHWKEHKPEHNRLVKLLPSTGETKAEPTEDNKKTTDENKSKTKKQKPNERCACGSKKKYKKCCGSKKRYLVKLK